MNMAAKRRRGRPPIKPVTSAEQSGGESKGDANAEPLPVANGGTGADSAADHRRHFEEADRAISGEETIRKLEAMMQQADAPDEAPAREAMRPTMRAEEDPLTRASKRAQELRDHRGEFDEGVDEFFIDPTDIPPGWTYEWKRRTVLGAEDPAYMVALARAGWEPVPTSRHPSYMPVGNYPLIERKGMILMERPLEITEEARDHELRKARSQVRQKEAQLNSAESGQFERANKDQSLVKVGRSYEPIPVPKD